MKTSIVSFSLAAAASAALLGPLTAGAPCDFGAIQGALFPNSTAGLEQCAAATGVDIWALDAFPTEQQVEAVMQDRGCVEFINQVNERANAQIQCEVTVGDQTVSFGELLVDFLTGQTGNATEVASGSSSEDIAFPDSESGSSAEASGESDAGSSEEDSEEGSEGSDEVGDESSSKSAGSASTSGAASAAVSMAVAGAALTVSLVL